MSVDPYVERREEMVRSQLLRRGIRDPLVLDAMRVVPRERFVPPELVDLAYADRAAPIGAQQTISQPYMVAVMTESLRLGPGARVLEIGTGSGYHAAVLSRIAREVFTIERHPDLAAAARERLAALAYTNVTVIVGDGTQGLPGYAPYQGILVAAASPDVPPALLTALDDDGRLVIPLGGQGHQDLVTVHRRGDRYERSIGEPCVFVPLVGRSGWPQ